MPTAARAARPVEARRPLARLGDEGEGQAQPQADGQQLLGIEGEVEHSARHVQHPQHDGGDQQRLEHVGARAPSPCDAAEANSAALGTSRSSLTGCALRLEVLVLEIFQRAGVIGNVVLLVEAAAEKSRKRRLHGDQVGLVALDASR